MTKIYERFRASLVIRVVQIKPTVRKHVTSTGMAIVEKKNNKCWWGCGKIETLTHCWWECNNVISVKRSLKSPQMLKIANLLLGIWIINENRYPHKNVYKNVHSIIIRNSTKVEIILKSISIEKWYIHVMEYYLKFKENEVLIHATTWVPWRLMLSERNQSQKTTYYMIVFIKEVSRIGKCTETGSRLEAAGGWGTREEE
jgi:hypothetical protein